MRDVRSTVNRLPMLCLLSGILLLPVVVFGGIPIQSGHSGSWYDPSRDGEGFLLEVVGEVVVAYWFTYDAEGGQQWVVGAGQITGSNQDTALVPVTVTSGAVFGDSFEPEDVLRSEWGSLRFEFSTCDTGRVDYESTVGFGSGRILLTRLTQLRNSACELAAPSVLGVYENNPNAGGTQTLKSNCSDELQNGVVLADSAALIIERQSGTDISGSLSVRSTLGSSGLSILDTGRFEGTVREDGSIQANFEATNTVADQPAGRATGTFTALAGDGGTMTAVALGISTDEAGGTCSLLTLLSLLKQ